MRINHISRIPSSLASIAGYHLCEPYTENIYDTVPPMTRLIALGFEQYYRFHHFPHSGASQRVQSSREEWRSHWHHWPGGTVCISSYLLLTTTNLHNVFLEHGSRLLPHGLQNLFTSP